MAAARSFAVGDKVTVRTGKTVWTVLEIYENEIDFCLVLASGRDRRVAYAKNCRAA